MTAVAPHTAAELATVLRLLAGLDARVVAVGHGRDPASAAAADALVAAWRRSGGEVLTVVDWPAVAASWRRPALRLAAGAPDAWVVADTPEGFARMAARLADTGWEATHTVGFAGLAGPYPAAVADAVAGLRGATATGDTWRLPIR